LNYEKKKANLVQQENRRRGLEVLAEFLTNMEEPPAEQTKKSAKGTKRDIYIR
jgi:hypothetical protein